MSSNFASSTFSYRFSDLSFELINIILAGVELHSDLAGCCRVNKHFLSQCQPALYHRLPILCGTPTIEPDDYVPGYILSQSSKLLFRTLEENKDLRKYPRKLSLETCDAEQDWVVNSDEEEGDSEIEEGDESRGHYDFSPEFDDPSEPFERCLRLLPKIDSVYLDSVVWWGRPVRDVVFNHGERWKEIKVSGELLTEEFDQRDLRDLSRLEKLECNRLGKTDLDDQYLPRTLRSLHASDCSLPAGDPSSEYQLSNVVTALTAETITNLSPYQKLEHLHLVQNWFECEEPPPPDALARFRSLPSLRSLSLSFDDLSPSYAEAAVSLLAHLPPSLSRLEFLDIVPFDILSQFVPRRSNQTPLALGFQDGVASKEGHKEQFDRLTTLCREHDIEIYSIPLPDYSWFD